MPRMTFTEHAVDRFIERICPSMSVDEACDFLEENAPQATRLKTRTILGQAQYQIDVPRCILVTKRSGGDDALTVVTVLQEPETFGGGSRSWAHATDEEREIVREAMDRIPIAPPAPVKPDMRPPPKTIDVRVQQPNGTKRKKPLAVPGLTPTPMRQVEVVGSAVPQRRAHLEAAYQEHMRLAMEAAAERDKQKTLRHFESREQTVRKLRRALKYALRVLVHRMGEDEAARAALEEIQEHVEPGYVTERFLASGGVKETGT